VVTSFGPVLPRLSEDFALRPHLAGILASLYSIGGLVAILGGWISDRADRILVTIISMVALAVSSLLLGLSLNPFTAGSCLILMGIAAGFLETALNAFVSDLYPEKRGLSVNLLHVGWNVGSTLGPSLAALIIVITSSWRRVYLVALPALVFLSFLLAGLYKIEPKSLRKDAPKCTSIPVFAKSVSRFLPITLIGFFYVAAEMGISTWLAFILEDLGSAVFEAGLTTGLYWGFMGVGRFIWAPATDRIGYERSITIASGSALACMIAAALPSPLHIKMGFWIFLGFFLAPIFPTLIAWGTSMNPPAGGTISGLIFTLGTLGLFSSTSLTGLVAASFGVEAAQYVFVFFTTAMLVNVLLVRKHPLHK